MFQAFSKAIREGAQIRGDGYRRPNGPLPAAARCHRSCHRDVLRDAGESAALMTTPMMHLQDPTQTRILIVTLPDITPVLEAARLQQDDRVGVDRRRALADRTVELV